MAGINALFCTDSFKGSLSSNQMIGLLTKAFHEVFPDGISHGIVVGDGGEGTLDAILQTGNYVEKFVSVHGPDGKKILAKYGIQDDKAVIEMAQSSGLTCIQDTIRNPLVYNTYGMGEVIVQAIQDGARDIYLGIGGSATMDGGMGCMRALGYRFLDKEQNELCGNGEDLEKVVEIDDSQVLPVLKDVKFTIMSDVTNPLCGKHGAVYTFGPQKGADDAMLERLEKGMQNYADVLSSYVGYDVQSIVGGGAAGGIGAALVVFLHAHMTSGIEQVLDLTDFDAYLEKCDLVITGEGRADGQSVDGKVISGVAKRCKLRAIPVIALCGSLSEGYEGLYDLGVQSFMTIQDHPMSLEECMRDASSLYYHSAKRMFEMIKCGVTLRK